MAISLCSTLSWSLSGKPAPVNGPIELQLVVEHDFSKPVFLTGSPDQTNRLFVVEQEGRIVILTPGQRNLSLFLDIAEKLSTGGNEGSWDWRSILSTRQMAGSLSTTPGHGTAPR